MECWGIGPFENEHALHWTAALAAGSAHPDAVVQQVLAREGRLPLELSIEAVCSATMAANTTVRVKKISMPREAWQWMDR